MPLIDTISKESMENKGRGVTYSENRKLEAVKLWLLSGNLSNVALALDIPFPTLRTWRYSDWWAEATKELKSEGTMQLSAKLRKIAEKALDIAVDRLENGDWVYDNKTGQVIRKEVSLKDAHIIASDFIDKVVVLEKIPQIAESQQKLEDRLSALAKAFTQMANKTRKLDVTDVLENNLAIPDQRQTGLQEGIELGTYEEPIEVEGSCEESSSPERGREDDGKSLQF